MKKLNEDFKSGKFEQVYLLYGEEGYLKKQYKKRFIKAMIPEGDTMNYAHYEGKNIPVKEVIDLAETMPFFAEKRLIVFENTADPGMSVLYQNPRQLIARARIRHLHAVKRLILVMIVNKQRRNISPPYLLVKPQIRIRETGTRPLDDESGHIAPQHPLEIQSLVI